MPLGSLSGALGLLVGIGFVFLDVRHEELVNCGRDALTTLEGHLRVQPSQRAVDRSFLCESGRIGRRAARSERGRRWVTHRRWLRLIEAAVALMFCLGALWALSGFAWFNQRRRQPAVAPGQPTRERSARSADPPAAPPDARPPRAEPRCGRPFPLGRGDVDLLVLGAGEADHRRTRRRPRPCSTSHRRERTPTSSPCSGRRSGSAPAVWPLLTRGPVRRRDRRSG